MRYGSGAMNKYEYAATIAASLAYLALRQQDAVGCVAFDGAVRTTVPLRTRRNHLDAVIQALEVSPPREKSDLYPVLRLVAETFPRRCMMVLVSDLLVDRARAVPRAEAAPQPRARRAGVPRAGRRRARLSLQRPHAFRGAREPTNG